MFIFKRESSFRRPLRSEFGKLSNIIVYSSQEKRELLSTHGRIVGEGLGDSLEINIDCKKISRKIKEDLSLKEPFYRRKDGEVLLYLPVAEYEEMQREAKESEMSTYEEVHTRYVFQNIEFMFANSNIRTYEFTVKSTTNWENTERYEKAIVIEEWLLEHTNNNCHTINRLPDNIFNSLYSLTKKYPGKKS